MRPGEVNERKKCMQANKTIRASDNYSRKMKVDINFLIKNKISAE